VNGDAVNTPQTIMPIGTATDVTLLPFLLSLLDASEQLLGAANSNADKQHRNSRSPFRSAWRAATRQASRATPANVRRRSAATPVARSR